MSSSLYRYFRHPDGSPMVARDPADEDTFPGEVRWSCSGGSVSFPDATGPRSYVDVAPIVVS
eukprot:9157654-Heterocapsa_arctica.AAC.1